MKKLACDPLADARFIRTYDEFVASYLIQKEQQYYFANFVDYQSKPEIETYVYLPITDQQRQQFEDEQLTIRQLYDCCQERIIYVVKIFTASQHANEYYQASLADLPVDWLPDPDSYLN